jgi:hypothetical protein
MNDKNAIKFLLRPSPAEDVVFRRRCWPSAGNTKTSGILNRRYLPIAATPLKNFTHYFMSSGKELNKDKFSNYDACYPFKKQFAQSVHS